MCILFVEDEPIISMVVAEGLTDAGHEVLAAFSADVAIEHVLSRPDRFSCLITHFNMSGALNGIDVINWTRAPYPKIPIILATALGHVISRTWLDRQRVTLVDKPYSPAMLAKTVQDLLAAC